MENLEIRPQRMIHLGYGKYWRSDAIVGLLPVEEDRGPGRRTKVYVSNRSEPVIASKTEATILEEMTPGDGSEEEARGLRPTVEELTAALRGLSPVLKRMLKNEGAFDVEGWIRRLEATGNPAGKDDGQEELFPTA